MLNDKELRTGFAQFYYTLKQSSAELAKLGVDDQKPVHTFYARSVYRSGPLIFTQMTSGSTPLTSTILGDTSLKIKSKGPLARYLGICLWTDYYNPRDFCTLFWLLVVSPLLFVFGVLIGLPIKHLVILIVKLLDWREEQLVSNLVKQYQNNKDILFQDYTDHYYRGGNVKLNRRSFYIVRLAMRRYAPEANKTVSIDTVVSQALGISETQLWTEARFDISSRKYPVPTQRNHRPTRPFDYGS